MAINVKQLRIPRNNFGIKKFTFGLHTERKPPETSFVIINTLLYQALGNTETNHERRYLAAIVQF